MKKIHLIFSFILCILSTALFTNCTTAPASLVGIYSIEEHGQLKEFIRIEKQGEKYFLSEKQDDHWLSPLEVTPVTKEKLESMLKETIKADFIGLGNNNAALFKVPKGWKAGQFECKTGYWLATMLGPVDLHKQ